MEPGPWNGVLLPTPQLQVGFSLPVRLHLVTSLKIADLNQSLEQRVIERTQKVEEQKARITELAFLTSHRVRGPLTSIMGITILLQDFPGDQKIFEMLPKLHHLSQEMDQVILNMNEMLSEEIEQNEKFSE